MHACIIEVCSRVLGTNGYAYANEGPSACWKDAGVPNRDGFGGHSLLIALQSSSYISLVSSMHTSRPYQRAHHMRTRPPTLQCGSAPLPAVSFICSGPALSLPLPSLRPDHRDITRRFISYISLARRCYRLVLSSMPVLRSHQRCKVVWLHCMAMVWKGGCLEEGVGCSSVSGSAGTVYACGG